MRSNRKELALILLITAAIAVTAFWIGQRSTGEAPAPSHTDKIDAEAEEWTCSMHPQIRQPRPGNCPICGMELVPVNQSQQKTGPRTFVTTPEAVALMDVQTMPVERRAINVNVRLFGKVTYDETRIASLTAWVPGRLEKMFINATGIPVEKGAPLVEIYSPDLLVAQQELIQALRTAREMQGQDELLRGISEDVVRAAREKLRLWGLAPKQIADMEKQGAPSERVTLTAPIGGVVIEKMGLPGMYVEAGTEIYRIADLSQVWVLLEAYEKDLTWLKIGQHVAMTFEALPGETREGRIGFIEPVLDEMKRTVGVRVFVGNEDGKLKPEMFASAVVHPSVTGQKQPADGEHAMHGSMDEMADAPAVENELPLVIPASAALVTGTRAIVYVKVREAEVPTFEGREVVLGPRAGSHYVVESGLAEGELVVTNGNFKIDAALQLGGKQSMMSPQGGGMPPGHQHGNAAMAPAQEQTPAEQPAQAATRVNASALVDSYLIISAALAADDFKAAKDATVAASGLFNRQGGDTIELSPAEAKELAGSIAAMSAAVDIAKLREGFFSFSESMITFARRHRPHPAPLYVIHCPMYKDGANWLQTDKVVKNPYLGKSMLRCGEVTETIEPAKK